MTLPNQFDDCYERERRVRRARTMANRLGLRLHNLRNFDGTSSDRWVLDPQGHAFEEVEAELLRLTEIAGLPKPKPREHSTKATPPPIEPSRSPEEWAARCGPERHNRHPRPPLYVVPEQNENR
jgi:hypothetical protein